SAEDDVGTAAGHVRGDRDCAFAARLGHDFGFALVVLGVEHLVLDATLIEQPGDALAFFDRDGTHEHRSATPLVVLYLAHRDRLRLLGILRNDRDFVGSFFFDRAGDQFAVVFEHLVVLVELFNFVGDGNVFFAFAAVDDVGVDRALQAFIGRN